MNATVGLHINTNGQTEWQTSQRVSSSHASNIHDPPGCGSFMLNFANKSNIRTNLAQKQIASLKWIFRDPEPTRNSKRWVLTHFNACYYLSWPLLRPELTRNVFFYVIYMSWVKQHTKRNTIFPKAVSQSTLGIYYPSFVFTSPTNLSLTSDFCLY